MAIAPGVYRESVSVVGKRHAGIRIVGNAARRGDVILDGSTLPASAPAAIGVELTSGVSISGLTIRAYPKAGIAIAGSTSTRVTAVTTHDTGTYGVRVTSSVGGVFDRIEAYSAGTAAVSFAATPRQEKPRRTYVRTLSAHESPIGFEAVNARYVTLTHGRLFNNGTGIALTASSALPNPPVEDNLIRANDIFWNNYDTRADTSATPANPAAPTGAGIYLFGSRANVLELNHVYGNWLVGLGASPNYLMALADPGQRPRRPQAQRGPAQRVRARRQGPKRPRHRLRRQRPRQLLRGQQGCAHHRSRRTARRSSPACRRPRTSTSRSRSRSCAPGRTRRTTGSVTATLHVPACVRSSSRRTPPPPPPAQSVRTRG